MAREHVTVSIEGMTCAACVARIEQALREQEGVVWANINFAAGQATLTYDPSAFGMKRLSQVITGLGYELQNDLPARNGPAVPGFAWLNQLPRRWQPVVVGTLAAVALFGLYLGFAMVAQGWQYTTELLWRDGWLAGAIALSTGLLVALCAHLRQMRVPHHRS